MFFLRLDNHATGHLNYVSGRDTLELCLICKPFGKLHNCRETHLCAPSGAPLAVFCGIKSYRKMYTKIFSLPREWNDGFEVLNWKEMLSRRHRI